MCKHITSLFCKPVKDYTLTKTSGNFLTEPENSFSKKRIFRSLSETHELDVKEVLKYSFSKDFVAKVRLHKEDGASYALDSTDTQAPAARKMIAKPRGSLKLIVDKSTAVSMQQPHLKITGMGIEALHKELLGYVSNNYEKDFDWRYRLPD